MLSTYRLSKTRPGTLYVSEWRERLINTQVCACTDTHTHRVQGTTECGALGVRLQEQSHPKCRLVLSLFNHWLAQRFEGPFNCRGDRALKRRWVFFTSFIDFSSHATNKKKTKKKRPRSNPTGQQFLQQSLPFSPSPSSVACFLAVTSHLISSHMLCVTLVSLTLLFSLFPIQVWPLSLDHYQTVCSET